MHADDQWITETYDGIVTESGDEGSTVKESREEFASRYEEAIRTGELERGELDLYDEGLSLFDRIVKPTRRNRSRQLQEDAEFIVAALSDETILGRDDPILCLAVPLGDANGRDKIIGLWSADDWRNAAINRYRKAAEATASAALFDVAAAIIEQRMLARHVDKTFDLFDGPSV